jgi:hypothetical protein
MIKSKSKKKEINFILDCTNPILSQLPTYNLFRDRNLGYFIHKMPKSLKIKHNRSQ